MSVITTDAATAEPGWQTSEFWYAIVLSGLGLLTAFGVIHWTDGQTNAVLGLVALVAPQVAYAISRGLRKAGTPH